MLHFPLVCKVYWLTFSCYYWSTALNLVIVSGLNWSIRSCKSNNYLYPCAGPLKYVICKYFVMSLKMWNVSILFINAFIPLHVVINTFIKYAVLAFFGQKTFSLLFQLHISVMLIIGKNWKQLILKEFIVIMWHVTHNDMTTNAFPCKTPFSFEYHCAKQVEIQTYYSFLTFIHIFQNILMYLYNQLSSVVLFHTHSSKCKCIWTLNFC